MNPPSKFEKLFRRAGWKPNRTPVAVDSAVLNTHPAFLILQSFSGLHVKPRGLSGIECATSDIEFRYINKNDSVEDIENWERRLNIELVGIAEFHKTYSQLWLANDGRYFCTNIVANGFEFVGGNLDNAIERLLTGLRVRPLLAPEQTSATIYSDTIARGDPRIYDWESIAKPDAG